ncbi:hypothetical protein AGABI1DRAFT_104925 [Agaricus bisporus var. burnettii JB137-S8]|uniref:Fungal-type protein kinase domain-containing protein n=1 Tax=Agaricus bisporus var. burnettii (strain JB137-S8 / ATCC MYA-4627 / FGSC 10392) TaxID=597362 RepID=K5W8M2_AGABU|nr:uncharacterized protein AGABI1DRAFT_104925 [Agaricus bisporus var. burnettii JB137-S8]EKM83209.1 hypothetical protein AGABI1DRAFT_104925 [Agaricus bisporus var. burnettii JB137-S8]
MEALLDRTTFLDTYLALPQSSPPLSAQSSPHQPSPPLQSRESQSSLHRPAGAQCSLPHHPQSQHANHESLSFTRHILNQLAVEGKYREGVWVGLPKKRRSLMQETDTHKVALMEILERIALLTKEYYRDIVTVPGRWIDPKSTSLQSWTRTTCPDLTPDIIFAHEETSEDEMFWSRTVSVLEFKKPPALEELDIYVTHIFAEQVDRLFVNTLTLKGCELQSPEDFIRVIASFSYLSPADLGWDSTCKVWDSTTKSPQLSYKLSQNVFRECGVYDIPWVFEVADESFVAIGPVNGKRSLSILGRASFVAHAVTLEDWENRNKKAKVYIFKQCWQRLPRLQSDPKIIELRNADKQTPDQSDRDELAQQIGLDIDKKPFEETVVERAGWTDCLRKSWTVEMNGKPITTFDAIRKNHATGASLGQEDMLERLGVEEMGFAGSSSATTPGTPKTMQNAPAHPALVTRTLVRLVFDRPGWPIERFKSKRELLQAVRMIVEELGLLYKKGVIHRDISPANLLISHSGGHIIDFDHSKIAFEKGVEVEPPTGQNVEEIATKLLKNDDKADLYVRALERLWKIRGRPATPEDFIWPTRLEATYLFGDRKKQDGFVTGTYHFLSPHLSERPFHDCTHDLDSLFWSVNSIPLRFEGPGGKERQDKPEEILNMYYTDGPGGKGSLTTNFLRAGGALQQMMSEYSDYFKDLIPFMEKWYRFVYIACSYDGYEYHQPHEILLEIIDEAINGLGLEAENGFENDAKGEEARRKKEKAGMAEAILKQMTFAAPLKDRKLGTVSVNKASTPTASVAVRNLAPVVACPMLSTPLVNRIPTALSPETDRVVKMSRANPSEPELT